MPLCALLFYEVPKSRMPEIDQNELIAHIEWNENIHIDENRERVDKLFAQIAAMYRNIPPMSVNNNSG